MSNSEQLVVLVSSSLQEARFWERLLPELQNFSAFAGTYHFYHLPVYATSSKRDGHSFLYHLFQRHQRQTEALSKALQRSPFAQSHPDLDSELILMALGPGCRLIQEYLLQCLNKDDNVRRLRRIRRVVFLTPPRSHWVAGAFGLLFILAPVGIFLYLLWPSTALLVGVASALLGLFSIATAGLGIATSPMALTMLGMESEWFLGARIRKEYTERIERGSRRRLGTWPIPQQELWPAKLKSASPEIVREISEVILQPEGHPNVYEIELFEYTFTIKPVQPKDLPEKVRDNLVIKGQYISMATLVSHIHFAGNDQTGNEEVRDKYGDVPPLELRQRTRGYLEVHDPDPDNLATSDENFAENRGYIYRFRAKSHEDRFLRVTIYGGYEDNNRDSHIHLRTDANYHLIRGKLDLSGYLNQNWKIVEPKVLFFHSHIPETRFSRQSGLLERDLKDLKCDCMTNKRTLGSEIPVQQNAPGIFNWEISDIRNGGIIAFEFDVLTQPVLFDEDE
jgi:hypothetical protein